MYKKKMDTECKQLVKFSRQLPFRRLCNMVRFCNLLRINKIITNLLEGKLAYCTLMLNSNPMAHPRGHDNSKMYQSMN